MKKKQIVRLLMVMCMLFMLMPLSAQVQKIPVAILRTNADGRTKTLTFTYAARPKMFARRGQNGIHKLNTGAIKAKPERYLGMNIDDDQPTWVSFDKDYNTDLNTARITKVVFDKSFARARPTSTYYWFWGMKNLKSIVGIENLNTSNVKYMDCMFYDCSSLESIDLSHFDTRNVKTMASMFMNCSSLESVDISKFDTSNLYGFGGGLMNMCKGCYNLRTFKAQNLNITDLWDMFEGCSNLKSVEFSGYSSDNVDIGSNFGSMFSGCSELTNIDLSSFNVDNPISLKEMFKGCSKLISLDISNFNLAKAYQNSYTSYKQASERYNIESDFLESANSCMSGMFSGCFILSKLNIGNNDFRIVGDEFDYSRVFEGIGAYNRPCQLIVGPEFDKSVLGEPQTDYSQGGKKITYYKWLGGYFTLNSDN